MTQATSPKKALTSVIVTWAFALIPANLVLTVIARLTNDFGMSVTRAGLFATAMTLLNSATTLIIRRRVSRGSRVSVAATGTSILVIAAIIGALFPSAVMIAGVLLVAGIGSGLTMASATASISATEDPGKSASYAMVFNRFVVAIAYFLVPVVGGTIQSTLMLLAIPGVLVLFTVRWLPRAPQEETETVSARGAGKLAWVLAAGFGFTAITDDGLVGLTEVFGLQHFGASGTAITLNSLAVATLLGLVGALIAPFLTRKIGRTLTLAIGLGVSLAGKLIFAVSSTMWLFSTGIILWGLAFGLILPVIFGLAAILKRDGSASVAVNGVYILGVALGPSIAGWLFDLGNIPLLFWTMGIVGLGAMILMVAVTPRIEKLAQA